MTATRNYNMINNKTGEYIKCSRNRKVIVSEKTKLAYEHLYASVEGDLLDNITFELLPGVDASTRAK